MMLTDRGQYYLCSRPIRLSCAKTPDTAIRQLTPLSMNLLSIPVGDLLDSHAGDTREYSFEGEIPEGYYDDLEFLSALSFRVRLISLDDGIEVIIDSLSARVRHEGGTKSISLSGIGRTYNRTYDPLAPDDVKTVNMKHHTIDLSEVVREEILISIL